MKRISIDRIGEKSGLVNPAVRLAGSFTRCFAGSMP